MIAASVVHQWVLVLFAGLLVWIAVTDVTRFVIPNRLTAALLFLYPFHAVYVWDGTELLYALAVAAAVFLVGTGLFALKLIGGGDVKLLAAVSLWAGPSLFLPFLLLTGFAGGLLALTIITPLGVYLVMPTSLPASDGDGGNAPGKRYKVPYGLAITVGGVWVALQLMAV